MEVPTLEDLVETCGGGAGAGSPAEGTGTVAAAAGAVVTRPPQQERTSAAADNKELLAMRYDAVRRGETCCRWPAPQPSLLIPPSRVHASAVATLHLIGVA